MIGSFYSPAVLTLGDLLQPSRRAAEAQQQAQMQNQLMQAQLSAERQQCQSRLQSEYQQAQMVGALLSPVSVRDAVFNSQMNAAPMIAFDEYGRDRFEIIDDGELIIDRITFWRQIPLAGKWIAARLAEQLDSISDTLERISARKLAHG